MANIKQVIKQSKVHQYEIAEYIGYNEFSLSRKLRKPVDADFERKILMAIRVVQMQKERGQADAGVKNKYQRNTSRSLTLKMQTKGTNQRDGSFGL